MTLTSEELQLLNSEQIHLWVPVVGHEKIQGLLALGPKLGGDIFSGEDMDILRILARQMSTVIENIHLVTQLKTTRLTWRREFKPGQQSFTMQRKELKRSWLALAKGCS